LYIRNPKWANDGVRITVNGKKITTSKDENDFLVVDRNWNNNDKVEITLPMTVHSEPMPDNPNRVAFLYGPVVLAGQLGSDTPDPLVGTPVLLTDDHTVSDWLKPVANHPMTFEMKGVGKPFDPIMKPFYQTYDQHYSVYFDFFTNADWAARQTAYETEKKRQKEIEENTIDNFRIGEMQPERDHNLKASEKSYVDEALGRTGREARAENYFSFEMKIMQGVTNNLMFTYIGDDKDRKFDVLVDGTKIATVDWPGGVAGKFYDVLYPIPADLIKDKTKITVRIEANYNKTAGRIFGCRIVRKN
jgi:hypothetical protein